MNTPRRALLIAGMDEVAPGAARLRLAMLAAHHRDAGFAVTTLALSEDPVGASRAARLRALCADCAFAAPADAAAAVGALDLAHGFDLVHLAASASPAIMPPGAVRLFDLAKGEGAPAPEAADILVAMTPEHAAALQAEGRRAVAAPWLRRAARRPRLSAPGARGLAGLWVEDPAPASAFLEAARACSGGFPPTIVIAGPGAAAIRPPPFSIPVTRLDTATPERVFWRGVDLAIFPDPGAAGLDAVLALEFGAAPLVVGGAPFGMGAVWRLPVFADPPQLAEYLFERGRDLREGGLMADLRARAEWTLGGHAAAASSAGAALHDAIRDVLMERTEHAR